MALLETFLNMRCGNSLNKYSYCQSSLQSADEGNHWQINLSVFCCIHELIWSLCGVSHVFH